MSNNFLGLAVALSIVFVLPAAGLCSSSETVAGLVQQIEWYAAELTNQLTILLLIALATLVSEDLACIAAGLLAARAIISPASAMTASALGIYIGDILLYLTGYLVGITALSRPPLNWFISEKTVRQSKLLFERRGVTLIFMSRFLPGTRTATFFAAGLVKMNLLKVLLVFALAVVIWTPVLVFGAMLVGKEVIKYVDIYSSYALWVFTGLFFGLFIFSRLIGPLFSWRGRRLLLSRWRRISRWEFWPYYVTNVLTLLYVLYLGCFRYRKPALFTAVNPAIKPDSGFIGESKSNILKGLSQDVVGQWLRVDGDLSFAEKHETLERFMLNHSLDYPVVLKPDRGQRGQGVGICKDASETDDWLKNAETDFIIMEFLPGNEYGVFYYRFPHTSTGKIFSITRKKLIFVKGDGYHTLEELILLDDRAVCMAPTFMDVFREDLLTVVPEHEMVQLVRVGTHSRGALFLDGSDLNTPELLEEIERIVRHYEGFYFGRFDIKADGDNDLRQGKKLRVIELNGVTSEATHIYDPANSVIYAWKTLMKQWSIAFQIASENHKRGNRPMSMKAFLAHCWRNGVR